MIKEPLIEAELGELCNLFIRVENLTPKDLSRAGIDDLTTFLIKTVGLQIDKSRGAWKEIKNIQKIRNLIAHNNAKLEDQNGDPIVSAIRYVATSPYLSGKDEINIQNGYLSHVLQTFDRQFSRN